MANDFIENFNEIFYSYFSENHGKVDNITDNKKWANTKNLKKKTTFIAPFYGLGSTASQLEPLRGDSLLFTTKLQKFLVLILSTLEGWKADSTLELPSGFEYGTPGLGIQRLNH